MEFIFSGWPIGVNVKKKEAGLTFKHIWREKFAEISNMAANKKRTWQDFQKMVGEKRNKNGTKKAKGKCPSSIMVQRMSSAPNRSKKYEPLDTRDFVDFTDYDELNIENIGDACEKFYDMPQGSCDILLSDRGPSCFLTEQISGKKFYYVRFTMDASIRKPSRASLGGELGSEGGGVHSNSTSYGNTTELSNATLNLLPPVPPTAFPKSVSVAVLLQAGKLVKPPNVTKIAIELESYLVAGKKWDRSMKVELSKEDNSFAEGGFRNAFLATDVSNSSKWVIKEYIKEHMEPLLSQLNMSADQHMRKQVQMHSVARSIAQSFERKVPSYFGKSFSYNKVYYSSIGNVPVTVEEYIPGTFEKYINNNGLISKAPLKSDEVIQKASCFAHFSYVHTNMQMMVLDLQGVAYTFCDPEIASARLLEDGELNSCAGNLSSNAINQFFADHICNKYCKMLPLPQYKKESFSNELLDGNLEA